MMVEPGDNVVLDVPTYPGTLAIVRNNKHINKHYKLFYILKCALVKFNF